MKKSQKKLEKTTNKITQRLILLKNTSISLKKEKDKYKKKK